MFADIIQNQNGKSAGFGSVEFKTKEEMEEIAKKLDGHEVSGRALKLGFPPTLRSLDMSHESYDI